MDPNLVLQLIALAIKLFGEGATIVQEIKAQAGMTDEQLQEAALAGDQETRDLVNAHLSAIAAAGGPFPPRPPSPTKDGGPQSG